MKMQALLSARNSVTNYIPIQNSLAMLEEDLKWGSFG
jgi:hypothetical protein